ncbi:hypothetical protein JOD43_001813 [Pullulanibacillus pueri]|uniref:ACT domain-containing protein n=1 Tax=Pullulanibacillus pueri TaxID=1437324 RepID=A0A8J2ZUD1_9BACL|nr:ACT domain-containing protein [Pullulanibacillus pueri]MBM7681646.1 hypothetical protein [Pullulanibacillus pueri]GGH79322.1 ACT domain-containing protein [Pullulanibacillus pueri]
MKLTVLPEDLAVIKLSPKLNPPSWIFKDRQFISVTYTDEELSIVCFEKIVPKDLDGDVEKGWSALKVEGPLDFSLTGILASLANPLADANVGIFAVSTYNTDYLLLKSEQLEKAINTLQACGHEFK